MLIKAIRAEFNRDEGDKRDVERVVPIKTILFTTEQGGENRRKA